MVLSGCDDCQFVVSGDSDCCSRAHLQFRHGSCDYMCDRNLDFLDISRSMKISDSRQRQRCYNHRAINGDLDCRCLIADHSDDPSLRG